MPRRKRDSIDLSASLPEVWRMLSDAEREKLRLNARILHFKKNELIYLEDEWPKDLMCLFKGKVKIYKSGVGGVARLFVSFVPCNTLVIVLFLLASSMLLQPPLLSHVLFA